MTDYFAQSNGGEATTNGTAAPANDGDAAMDEISVRIRITCLDIR